MQGADDPIFFSCGLTLITCPALCQAHSHLLPLLLFVHLASPGGLPEQAAVQEAHVSGDGRDGYGAAVCQPVVRAGSARLPSGVCCAHGGVILLV